MKIILRYKALILNQAQYTAIRSGFQPILSGDLTDQKKILRLKIVNAIFSPWLQITSETGNFLENQYAQLEMMAPKTFLIQA